MELFDRVGDFFTSVTAGIERTITGIFGASNERQMKRLGFERNKQETRIRPGSMLDRINQLEPEWEKLTEAELEQTAAKFRERIKAGETLDDLLPEAFAAVREAGKRYLRMRHYDVQMIGGYVLHNGMIAEMVTGEGKTLVATLPAFLNALTGKVHVVTVNDYLARRDMEWMAPVYTGLGLTVGAIQAHQPNEEKIAAYSCDITYGTNNEFGFDYLRDNMKPTREMQVQGPLKFAIVDEIDNILIDEARTPLIISGPADDDPRKYAKANQLALQLRKDEHFEVKEKEHSCHLTEAGVRHAEELAGVESFYTAGNMEWPHLIDNALKAHHLYKRDVNYVSMQGEIIIVDEFTGRLMKGRQWSDGLHQAVEAKEGVPIKAETQTLATITLQNYFKLYKKLAGMTGTAMTEANEFWKIYKLDVVSIPSNRPMRRLNSPDVIFRSEREKFNAIVDEIAEVHTSGRPILVGTVSIEKSELLSERLGRKGIKHEVLNAKHHEREAEIISQAGRLGAVTIATNMAGRGTDIILGGNPETLAWEQLKTKYESRLDIPKAEWNEVTQRISDQEGMAAEGRKVAETGGLHVIGTERHEARRIDLQLRGRSGRQGDPGSSRFFLSLEDDLMRIFAGDWVKDLLTRLGMQEGEAIESRMVSRRIEAAQKKVEERHFDTRKNLLEYDEVMDQQRKRVYSYRQRILDGADCRELIQGMIHEQIEEGAKFFLSEEYGRQSLSQWAAHDLGIEIDAGDLANMRPDEVMQYLRDQSERQAEDLIFDKIEEDLPEEIEDQREWNWLSLSKWANMRWGLNTNDRELKKVGRESIAEYLIGRAKEAIQRADLSAVETFLAEDFNRRAVCGWLREQFGVEVTPEQVVDKAPADAAGLILEQTDQLYRLKEMEFPVAVGMNRFMAQVQGAGERYDREGLIRWANNRFDAKLDVAQFASAPRHEIEHALRHASEQFYCGGEFIAEIDRFFGRAFGPMNGTDSSADRVRDRQTLTELVEWAQRELRSSLQVADLESLPRGEARERVVQEYDKRYRPELAHAERVLILEILDTDWKDHLHGMDHLRQGIGLMGYAQKDPKVEYKREGMRAFDQMWKQIGNQVTRSFFRLEQASGEFVGSLWQITATTHEAAPTASSYEAHPGGDELGGPHESPGDKVVEPIRNFGQRVGRNDPCPCGSWKKYKNCCLKR